MCLSSPTYCNCSFTIECLNNSLQILCIYAELLNSAVCCSVFLVLLVFPVAVRPLLLLHIALPAPLSWALLTTSLLLCTWQNQRAALRRRHAGCSSQCPHLSMHCCRNADGAGGGCPGRRPIAGRPLFAQRVAGCESKPSPVLPENPKCTKLAPYFQSRLCRSV